MKILLFSCTLTSPCDLCLIGNRTHDMCLIEYSNQVQTKKFFASFSFSLTPPSKVGKRIIPPSKEKVKRDHLLEKMKVKRKNAAARKILSKTSESEEAGQENPDFLSDSEVSLYYLNLSPTGSTSAPTLQPLTPGDFAKKCSLKLVSKSSFWSLSGYKVPNHPKTLTRQVKYYMYACMQALGCCGKNHFP